MVSWQRYVEMFLGMRKICVFQLLMFTFATLSLQSANVFKEAKAAIKSGQNLENAERNLLVEAVKPELEQSKRAQCYFMAGMINRKINDIENEKLYLKKSYDTVKFFNSIHQIFVRLGQCDSVETIPGENGHVVLKYRKRNREMLMAYRPNLLNGGKYFLRKGDYEHAYAFFDLYIGHIAWPMFAEDDLAKKDTMLAQVAYWSTLSAFYTQKPIQTLKYVDLAMKTGTNQGALQEYKARSYYQLGDTVSWLESLKVGLITYPEQPYFFVNLMDYVTETKQFDDGIKFADLMIKHDPKSVLYRYAKSAVLFNKHDYSNCIVASDSVLMLDSTYVDAHYNKGISYCNLALIQSDSVGSPLKNPNYKIQIAAVKRLYSKARRPMEMVRKLQPDQPNRWAQPLYRIYLNLNMGKEFDEIDRLLRKMK